MKHLPKKHRETQQVKYTYFRVHMQTTYFSLIFDRDMLHNCGPTSDSSLGDTYSSFVFDC